MAMSTRMKTMKTKDIESVLVLAGWSYTVIRVVIDYSNKTPEEKEKFSEKIGKFVDKTIKLIISYYGSPEIYKKAIVDEITKIGKQQVVAEVHEIFEINAADYSNEMTFTNPYQYPDEQNTDHDERGQD